jgi:hypothetical protein
MRSIRSYAIADSGVRLEVKLNDLWIGAFWRTEPTDAYHQYRTDLWVCIVPCLPLHFWWTVTR